MTIFGGKVKAGFLVFFFLCTSASANAEEFKPLFRGTRAQAMGNAFVAVADDEEALFYNPAGLAGIKTFSLQVVNGNADLSNDFINNYSLIASTVSNPGPSALNTIVGKNLYARGEGTVSLTLPGFGLSAIADQQVALRLQNTALPNGTFASQSTYGAQLGFGIPLFKLKRGKGEMRFGMSGKVLWRAGGYQSPTLTQLLTLNAKAITGNLSNFGLGVGVDSGVQFIYKARRNLSLQAALVMTDMGNTTFANGGDTQKANLTAGLAAILKSGDMIATLAYDYSNITDYGDWRLKNHFGLELKFPVVSLYAGLNQFNVTYGAALDLWLFKISYASYGQELSTLMGVNPERRQMLQVALKFEL